MILVLLLLQLLFTLHCPIFISGSDEFDIPPPPPSPKRLRFENVSSAFKSRPKFSGTLKKPEIFTPSPAGVAINLSEISNGVEVEEGEVVGPEMRMNFGPVSPMIRRRNSFVEGNESEETSESLNGRFTPLENILPHHKQRRNEKGNDQEVDLTGTLSNLSIEAEPAQVVSELKKKEPLLDVVAEDVDSDDSDYEGNQEVKLDDDACDLFEDKESENVSPPAKKAVEKVPKVVPSSTQEDFPIEGIDSIDFAARTSISDRFEAYKYFHEFLTASDNFEIPRKLDTVPKGMCLLRVSMSVRRYRKSLLREEEIRDGLVLADAILKCSMSIGDLVDVTEYLMRAGMKETSIELIGSAILPYALKLRNADKQTRMLVESEKPRMGIPHAISFIYSLATSGRVLLLQNLLNDRTLRHFLLRDLKSADCLSICEVLLHNGSLTDKEVWKAMQSVGILNRRPVNQLEVDNLVSTVEGKRGEKIVKAIQSLSSI